MPIVCASCAGRSIDFGSGVVMVLVAIDHDCVHAGVPAGSPTAASACD